MAAYEEAVVKTNNILYKEAVGKAKDIFSIYNVKVECLCNDYIKVSVEGELMSGGWVSRSFLDREKIEYNNKTQIVQKELFIQIITDLS